MINYLKIKHYRKLKDIEIDLSKRINIISGTNGTCKSSILYMVSNAFRSVYKELHADCETGAADNK